LAGGSARIDPGAANGTVVDPGGPTTIAGVTAAATTTG